MHLHKATFAAKVQCQDCILSQQLAVREPQSLRPAVVVHQVVHQAAAVDTFPQAVHQAAAVDTFPQAVDLDIKV